MDDNIRNPKTKVEAIDQVVKLLEVVRDTKHLYKSKEVVFTLIGRVNAVIKAHRTDTQSFFGCGSDHDEKYWMALLRQVLVAGYLSKDIETYGIVKITKKGLDFIKNRESFMMSEDHEYNETEDEAIVTAAKSTGAVDEVLMSMLRDLRKKVAKKLGVPPFVVFQDPSLEDMALKYPVSQDELINIHGVGEGKAKKYGKEFLADKGYDPAFGARPLRRAVQKYVEDPLAEEILKGTFAQGSKVKVKFIKKSEELKFVDSSKDKGGDELKEHDEEVADVS